VDLVSDSLSSLTSLKQTDPGLTAKLDKQAEGYEQMLIKLEGDVRQHPKGQRHEDQRTIVKNK
jgi:hypothetical protein